MEEITIKDPHPTPFQRFLRLLSLERREISHIYLYAIFSGLINLSLPLGIQAILGLVLANELSSSWVLLVGIVTLGTILAGALQIMQISITEMIQQRIFVRSSFEFAYRLPKISMGALFKKYPPELVNRFFDTLTIQKGLPKILIDLSTASLQILFGLVLLSFYHPFFLAFGFILLVLLFAIFRFTGPMGLRTSLQESDYKYQVVHWLEEVARTLSSFKLAGKTNLALEKTDQLVTSYLGARKKHFRVLIFQFSNIVLFKTLVTAGLLILGSKLLIERELNVGQFVASEIVIILIINNVEKLILSMETIYDVLTAVEKIGKVTDLPLEREEGIDFKEIATGYGVNVKVQGLNFAFPGEKFKSLNDVNFRIKAGEKVCVAGHAGSGKTVLLNVISGLYENYDGSIAFNDIPLVNIGITSLRSNIGDCLSQKNLFKASVLDNVTMGSDHITLENVLWALDRLDLSDFVRSLPEGLETIVNPETPQLPFSITRKLVLARSIAKRPQLLIMDDFFSVWEKDDKRILCEFLTCNDLDTVISVSNDKMFANMCSKVIIMENGTVIDIGKPEQIVEDPKYSSLFH
jgi:ABC-type bacteriocin/lantibiotic exporter with double-glycine peptidase domain